MTIVFLVLGAVLVFVIAAVFVGTESFRLGHTPESVVFDLDEALYTVVNGLSEESASGLTIDEVTDLIHFSLDHFRAKGVTAMPGEELAVDDSGQAVVLADDEAVAVVLGRADEHEMLVTDEAVLEVLDLLLAHLADIGAVGPVAGS